MKKLLKLFLIPISQIIAVLCALGLSGQLAAIYMLATNQVEEGQPMFMDSLAPNFEDTLLRTSVTLVIFIATLLIAYKGKIHLTTKNSSLERK